MTISEVKQLENKIREIRDEIAALGDIRPGSLTQQSRGTKGDTYGQYWSLSYTFKSRSHTDYVPARGAEQVRIETENYKRLRDLVEGWTEHAIQLSKLRIKETPRTK
jgi:hypothetical protein